LLKKGKPVFVKNGKEVTMTRFGTSVVGSVMGIKHAIAQFIIDFAKPSLLFFAFIYPLATYTEAFSSAMVG
jgi:hypothetical protein